MFCPQCGRELSSDRVRFCTQCRFPVGSFKEFIAMEAAMHDHDTDVEKRFSPLSQIDITVGASLMIVGVIISLITALSFNNKWLFAGVATFLSMLGSVFGLILLVLKSSPRRRGLNLGATLAFICSLIATIFAQQTDGMSFLIIAAIAIPAILLWTRIARFFFDVDTGPQESRLIAGEPFSNAASLSAGTALPLVQGQTTTSLNPQQVRMEELGERFSVTEDSTDLLKNKHTYNP
jgi:hypothetical protein